MAREVGARGPQDDIDFTMAAVQLHKHSRAACQQPMTTGTFDVRQILSLHVV